MSYLLTYIQTDRHTDKVIHRGAPILKTNESMIISMVKALHSINTSSLHLHSDGNSFCGDVVLDSFKIVYLDEDIILDHE